MRQKASLSRSKAEAAVAAVLRRLKTQGTFGVDALSDVDAWTLSGHYEFLVDSGGDVTVGHDLVADHLAGQLLAQRWRDHVPHLESLIGQDSWVFGAANVATADVQEFMQTVLRADLVLAARCAVEVGPGAVAELESDCLAAIDSADLFSLSSGIVGAAILGTEPLLAKLRWCVQSGSPHQAERAIAALAGIGDASVVGHILERAEDFARLPFKVSGGEISLWHQVPGHLAVRMARERLVAPRPDSNVVISVQTIHTYGEKTDFEAVQEVMRTTERVKVYSASVSCLAALDLGRSQALLAGRAGPTITRESVCDAWFAHKIGASVEVSVESIQQLLGVIDLFSPEAKELIRLVSDIPFSDDAGHELRRMYDDESTDRSVLWQLAAAHQVSEFDELAWSAISDVDPSWYGYAARFALERWEGPTLAPFTQEAMVRAGEISRDLDARNSWDLQRLLDVAMEGGHREDVARLLATNLPGWLERHRALNRRSGVSSDPAAPTSRASASTPADLFFRLRFGHLVTYASQVGESLPTSVLRQCVHLHMAHLGDESRAAYGRLLRFLGPNELDDELESIENPFEQLVSLAIAVTYCGSTVRRVEVLKGLIRELFNVTHDKFMAVAVSGLWSEDILSVLVGTIADRPRWNSSEGFSASRTTRAAVVCRLSPDLVDRVVAPAAGRARTEAAQELLEFWTAVGKRSQVSAKT